jgi:hypothetical protein
MEQLVSRSAALQSERAAPVDSRNRPALKPDLPVLQCLFVNLSARPTYFLCVSGGRRLRRDLAPKDCELRFVRGTTNGDGFVGNKGHEFPTLTTEKIQVSPFAFLD